MTSHSSPFLSRTTCLKGRRSGFRIKGRPSLFRIGPKAAGSGSRGGLCFRSKGTLAGEGTRPVWHCSGPPAKPPKERRRPLRFRGASVRPRCRGLHWIRWFPLPNLHLTAFELCGSHSRDHLTRPETAMTMPRVPASLVILKATCRCRRAPAVEGDGSGRYAGKANSRRQGFPTGRFAVTRSQAELAGRRSRGQLDVRVAGDGHGPSGRCRRDNGQTGRMQPVFSQEPPRALNALQPARVRSREMATAISKS